MPRKFTGSWEGPPHCRWVKMFRGVRYRIACTDLAIPKELWTKEGSYQAAKGWWVQKHAEIVSREAAAHPHAGQLANLQKKLAYAQAHGLEEVLALVHRIQEVQATPADEYSLDPDLIRFLEDATG